MKCERSCNSGCSKFFKIDGKYLYKVSEVQSISVRGVYLTITLKNSAVDNLSFKSPEDVLNKMKVVEFSC